MVAACCKGMESSAWRAGHNPLGCEFVSLAIAQAMVQSVLMVLSVLMLAVHRLWCTQGCVRGKDATRVANKSSL